MSHVYVSDFRYLMVDGDGNMLSVICNPRSQGIYFQLSISFFVLFKLKCGIQVNKARQYRKETEIPGSWSRFG